MGKNTNHLREKADELFRQEKFNEIIELLTDNVLKNQSDPGLYVQRGNARYNNNDYNGAIKDYDEAIAIDSGYELAFYNRGLSWFVKKEYDKAIEDYNKAIKLYPNYEFYLNRGYAWKAKEEYTEAINDYTKAIEIKPDFENAYYSRGLAKKEGKIDMEGSKQDFQKYLELTADENGAWTNYAKYYIEVLDIRINDKELSDIIDIVDAIKNILCINEDCVTHYTSLSTLKKLIFDNNKFRMSEGNFMNDLLEGNEFFNFLQFSIFDRGSSFLENFSSKPFIGCFVTKDKHNDLNMWRFYGKENGKEAKGCAITLRMQNFIDAIKDSISTEKNKDARPDDESDIKFY